MDAAGMLKRKCHKAESGSVSVLAGEHQENNVKQIIQKMTGMIPCWNHNIWKKSLIQIQNLQRAEGNPDWGLNQQQCRSERKDLDSAC